MSQGGSRSEPGDDDAVAGTARTIADESRAPTTVGTLPTLPGRGHASTVDLGTSNTIAADASNDSSRGALRSPRADHDAPDFERFVPVDPLHYADGNEIARGGMGRIVVVRDRRLGRSVALKELLEDADGFSGRFEREARITARLEHPSIVSVHEAGVWTDGRPFYAMKWVQGRSFDRVIAEKKTLDERLELLPNLVAIADAMAYAHDKRIIHRDLKPTNVLLGPFGETVVIDWGLAKDLAAGDANSDPAESSTSSSSRDGMLTVSGAIMGTPAYMPPEQATGLPVDERADVFALGALIYHALSGFPPYEGASVEQILSKVLTTPPPRVAAKVSGVPRDLAAIVDKAMARDPADRYDSARGLAEDLRRFQTGQLVRAHAYSPAERAARFVRKNRAILAVVSVATIAVTTLGVMDVRRVRRERDAARTAFAAAESARAVSEHERMRERTRTAELLEEEGREEWLRGGGARAAVFLAEAYSMRADAPVSLRFLLTRSLRALDGEILRWEGHARAVRHVSYDLAGTRIATASEDGTVGIWNATSGASLATIRSSETGFDFALITTDGSQILTRTTRGLLELWSSSSGTRIAALGSGDAFGNVTTPDDARTVLAIGNATEVAAFSLRDGSRLGSFACRAASDVNALTAVNARGTVVGCVDSTGALLSSPIGPRTTAQRIPLGRPDARSLEIDPDGTRAAISFRGGDVIIRDLARGTTIATLATNDSSMHTLATFAPDGRTVLAGSGTGVGLYDAISGTPRFVIADGENARALFSRDGSRIATWGHDSHVRVWDARNGALVGQPGDQGGRILTSAFAPDGASLVTVGEDRRVRVSRTNVFGPEAILFGHAGEVTSATFHPRGNEVLTAGSDGTVRVWDAASGAEKRSIPARQSEAAFARYNSDGSRALTMTTTGAIVLWDATSWSRLASLSGHGGGDRDPTAMFSDDGRQIVTTHGGDFAFVWNAATGVQIATLGGYRGTLGFAVLSPDGSLVATSGEDHGVRIWNVATRASAHSLTHPAAVRSATFSPSGTLLATSCADGFARLWKSNRVVKLQRFRIRVRSEIHVSPAMVAT